MNIQDKLRIALGVLLILAMQSTLQAAQTGGGGGQPPPPPPDPDDPPTIEEIQEYFDTAVSDGTVSGTGQYFFVEIFNRWRFAYALERARLASDELDLDAAYSWLAYGYLRCDEMSQPLGDWVQGEGVADMKHDIMGRMTHIANML